MRSDSGGSLDAFLDAGALAAGRRPVDHAARLSGLSTAAELAAYLRGQREAIIARLLIPPAPDGLIVARALSDLTDSVVARLYAISCGQVGVDPKSLPVCIIATGGYGRRHLSPFSDIDITFVPQRDGDARTDRVIREMFRHVMDICMSRCGLEVGYAYRLMDDFGALDHQTVSGLLDARLIAGSDRLFIQFEDAFWASFNGADFVFTKLKERAKELEKWGHHPRVVEPQLKNGPGGLRDLSVMIWLAQARKSVAAAQTRGTRAFDMLIRTVDMQPEIAQRLAIAQESLIRVRNALHAAAGAGRDTLVVTRQEQVALQLGYFLDDGETPAVERMMADIYPHMVLLRRTAAQVMTQIENSRLILGIGLDCKRRSIVPANGALDTDDPGWLLWAFELAQRYQLGFSVALERAAVSLVETHAVPSDPSASAQVFTRILSQVGAVYPVLQRMADLEVLRWFLPEFGCLEDLIPYDPAHDYTVGQHTLYVIRCLEELLYVTPSDPEEMVEMRRTLLDLPHPEHLALAALLHDSGKVDIALPHAEAGERIADAVCKRLGWSEDASADVRFLVRHHLLMAETSRLRDLNIDETILEFVRVVDDIDRLNMLYLLTYADTRAVGEGVWTPVKGHFLSELWRRASMALADEESFDHDEMALTRARRRLLKDLTLPNLPPELVSEHIQSMPSAYLLNQTPSRMALHIDFVRRVRDGETVIDFMDERTPTYTEITVCAYDDPEPGLLARIAGVLFSAGLVIYGAQVTTRVSPIDRIALDVLWVDHRGRRLSVGKRKEIATRLSAALGRKTGSEAPESETILPATPEGEVHVRAIRNDLTSSLTVIETAGPDEQGALYWPSAALAQLKWNIQSARVSIWQGEARAVFYVSGIRGLPEDIVRARLEERLARRVTAVSS